MNPLDDPRLREVRDLEQWITEPELARRLGYSRTTMRRLRARGLPHVGRDRLRRYDWRMVLAWLAKHA